MLEKIGAKGFESISKPSQEVLEVLELALQEKPSPIIAEIGVGIGATTLEICRMVNSAQLHLFDFDDNVSELIHDLEERGIAAGIDIIGHGNGRETFNSYAWTLASDYVDCLQNNIECQKFDFVYLDGAHSFHYDAPACVILKEMIAPGGYLIFDDMYWSFNSSPAMNPENKPEIKNQYSESQRQRPHVEMVVLAFMKTDDRFEQIFLTGSPKPYRPVFRRRDQSLSRDRFVPESWSTKVRRQMLALGLKRR